MRAFQEAIGMLGTTDCIDRWMLPDGRFLAWPDGQDHRWCGQWCPGGYENWTHWIKEGGVTVHFDYKATSYIHIRTNGLTTPQRLTWERLYDSGLLQRLDEMYLEEHDWEDRGFGVLAHNVQVTQLKDSEMIKLYLTDSIGYQMEVSRLEDMEHEDEYRRAHEDY